jgi:hypothetical protein
MTTSLRLLYHHCLFTFHKHFLIQTNNNSMVWILCIIHPHHDIFLDPVLLDRLTHTNPILIFINNNRIYRHYHPIFGVILISNRCPLRYHLIFYLLFLLLVFLLRFRTRVRAPAGGDRVPSTSTSSTSTSTSTSPHPGSSSSISHTAPPVPIPLTVLLFPLDSIQYYLLGQLEYYMSPQNMVQDFFLSTQVCFTSFPLGLILFKTNTNAFLYRWTRKAIFQNPS